MNVSDVIREIENNPFELEGWNRLSELLRRQKDLFTGKSVDIIIKGLRVLKGAREASSFASLAPLLIRLVRASNNPSLFKQLGKAYLHEFRIAEPALEHLQHAVALGSKDADLRGLIDAAKAMGAVKSPDQDNKGVSKQEHARKVVSETIRKTGMLSLIHQAILDKAVQESKSQKAVPNHPETCLSQARLAIASTDLDYAKRLLSSLAVSSVGADHLWEAWTQLGECCYEAGRYDDAVFAYRAAHKLIPDNLVSRFNLGLGLESAQKYEEALEAYHEADAIHPDHHKVWCNIGNVYFLMENYIAAEEALRKTVLIKRDYARAWDNLAAALGAQGKIEEAIPACENALVHRPDFPEAQFKLAVIYFSQQEFKKALSCIAAASTLPSLTFYTNAYLSMTLAEMGNSTGAEKALSMAACSSGVVPEILSAVWRTLGRARMKSMETKRAIDALKHACELGPVESQNWLDLGLAHQLANEEEPADRCFKRAMALENIATAA